MRYETVYHWFGIVWANRSCLYVMDDFGTLIKVPQTWYFPNQQRH